MKYKLYRLIVSARLTIHRFRGKGYFPLSSNLTCRHPICFPTPEITSVFVIK